MCETTRTVHEDQIADSAKGLVLAIAQALAEQPELVRVETVQSHDGEILLLLVSEEDGVRISGKDGRTARSLEALVAAMSAKAQRRMTLRIVSGEIRC